MNNTHRTFLQLIPANKRLPNRINDCEGQTYFIWEVMYIKIPKRIPTPKQIVLHILGNLIMIFRKKECNDPILLKAAIFDGKSIPAAILKYIPGFDGKSPALEKTQMMERSSD